MRVPTLPKKLCETINRELECGERIEWIGMPKRVFFTSDTIILFLFGIPWTALALSWTVAAVLGTSSSESGHGIYRFLPLFGLPFVLIGIGLLSSPLWVYWTASRTGYVITDRRAITIFGGWSTTIRSYTPDKLTDIFRKENRDGSGDVIIDKRTWWDSSGDRESEDLGIFRVTDAKDVERRLMALAEKADRSGG